MKKSTFFGRDLGRFQRWDAIAMSGESSPSPRRAYVFDDFRLDVEGRRLTQGGREVILRGREFDLLVALAADAGRFVSKDDLLARVWPTVLVSESSLRVQMSALRRSLGVTRDASKLIVNVTGRGYSLTAQARVEHIDADQGTDTSYTAAGPDERRAGTFVPLPLRLSRLIGREGAIAHLVGQIEDRRLVTVVGSGGIGKTSLAVAVAQRVGSDFEAGCAYVDLSTVTNPAHVEVSLALAIGAHDQSGDHLGNAVRALQKRQVLLVFDNCEHVIEAAAAVVDRVLREAPEVSILATSREPLKTEGEGVYRIGALAMPPIGPDPIGMEALSYGSVELFSERAREASDAFRLTADTAELVASICRSLDGVPLAIELAAARADLGLVELSSLLQGGSYLAAQGRRTAQPRQQTLNAMLDWSFRLLTARQAQVLARLSIFTGGFPLSAAEALLADGTQSAFQVADDLAELVGKSLVTADTSTSEAQYRLLETTRLYAGAKLNESGDRDDVAARHASVCLDILLQAKATMTSMEPTVWRAYYGRWLNDVRAAMDWCDLGHGDRLLGVRIVAFAAPLAVRLPLLREYRKRVVGALETLSQLNDTDPALELQLLSEYAYILLQTRADREDLESIRHRLSDLSSKLAGHDQRLDTLQTMFNITFSEADWPATLKLGKQAAIWSPVAADDSPPIAVAHMLAHALHHLGEHAEARELAAGVLAGVSASSLHAAGGGRLNARVDALMILSRIAWLQGFPDRARCHVEEMLQIARSRDGHSLSYALSLAAIPIAAWNRDDVALRQHVAELMDVSGRERLDYWRLWGVTVRELLDDRQQMNSGGLPPLLMDEYCVLDPRAVDEIAVTRSQNGVGWSAPEIMRGRAENLFAEGAISSSATLRLLDEAASLARNQGALGWELRAALASHRVSVAVSSEREPQYLTDILSRFTEGWATGDVMEAVSICT